MKPPSQVGCCIGWEVTPRSPGTAPGSALGAAVTGAVVDGVVVVVVLVCVVVVALGSMVFTTVELGMG